MSNQVGDCFTFKMYELRDIVEFFCENAFAWKYKCSFRFIFLFTCESETSLLSIVATTNLKES